MNERINIGQLHRWEELKRYEYKHGLLSDEMIAALEAEGFDFEAQPEYSLAADLPWLADEWNYEKNGSLTPNDVTAGSNKTVWWKCSKGHEWTATIANRPTGQGCPYCSGRRVLAGFNDVATTKPELAAEWNYEKNGTLTPRDVTAGSNKTVWWKCSKGHEWQTRIDKRSEGGCPYCSGRRVLAGFNDLATIRTDLAAEWNYEKNGSLTPRDVTAGSGKKVWWKCSKGHEWPAVIQSRSNGAGCPYCSGRRVLAGINDLATTRPDLSDEWNYEKNGDLSPRDVTAGSQKKVWWKCSKGHEWPAVIHNRSNGTGCSYCSGHRVLAGFNDLATTKPELAAEWNYEKNGTLTPRDVTAGSHKEVWWKCSKGHEWQAIINNRSDGAGCKECYKDRRTRS